MGWVTSLLKIHCPVVEAKRKPLRTTGAPVFLLPIVPQIAGSYRGSNFSKGGIVLANWPTSGCCSECCAGCCPGCCCGRCPGCSGSCLPLGGVRVLSGVLRIMFAIGRCQGAGAPGIMFAIQRCLSRVLSGCSGSCLPLGGVRVLSKVRAPDHVCYWAVSGCCWGCGLGCCPGCCPGCSGSCLRLGGVRTVHGALQGALQSALQGAPDMFAIGRCQGSVQGAVQGAPDHVQGAVQDAVQSALQGAPDHVCHWAVSGCCPGCCVQGCCWGVLSRVLRIMFASALRCCPGCSGSRLLLGGVRVLSIQRFNFYLGSMLV